MKIPLDYFLYIIKNFLDEVGLKNVTKVLKNHIDIPEEEFVNFYLKKLTKINFFHYRKN
jgi:hypothetical protein